jgi:hypothetical protein
MSPPGVRVRARDLSGRRRKVNGIWAIAPRPSINEIFIELLLCNKFIFCIVNCKLISAFVCQDCELRRYFRDQPQNASSLHPPPIQTLSLYHFMELEMAVHAR